MFSNSLSGSSETDSNSLNNLANPESMELVTTSHNINGSADIIKKLSLENNTFNEEKKEIPAHPESKSAISKDIDQVIAEAKKTFVPGHVATENFKDIIKKNPAIQAEVRNVNAVFPQYIDEYFTWNANRIEGTNFVAAAGPRDKGDVGELIANTVFNDRLPIQHIIAIGSCLASDEFVFQDFHDYCIKDRKETFGSYEVTIEKISGDPQFSLFGNQSLPNGIVHSHLFISPTNKDSKQNTIIKQLSVTIIGLEDNTTLDLISEANHRFTQSPEERKEILWQLYQLSLREPILVHCAAGIGRTGHIIFTLEILKYYDSLKACQNTQAKADFINQIKNRIRLNRPALLQVESQFEKSISNAEILYQYALDKKYIDDLNPVYETKNISNIDDEKSINSSQILPFNTSNQNELRSIVSKRNENIQLIINEKIQSIDGTCFKKYLKWYKVSLFTHHIKRAKAFKKALHTCGDNVDEAIRLIENQITILEKGKLPPGAYLPDIDKRWSSRVVNKIKKEKPGDFYKELKELKKAYEKIKDLSSSHPKPK